MSANAKKKANPNRLALQMVIALVAGIIAGLSSWPSVKRWAAKPGAYSTISSSRTSLLRALKVRSACFTSATAVRPCTSGHHRPDGLYPSIAMAIGTVSDARTLEEFRPGRCLWFLMTTVGGLLLASIAGMAIYEAGWFSTNLEGLSASSGSTGSTLSMSSSGLSRATSARPSRPTLRYWQSYSWRWSPAFA